MRWALFFGFVLIATSGQPVLAQEDCTIAGAGYANGAALCQPALRDGRVEQMLFACEGGAWKNTEARCPEEFAYSCRIGPHAVPVGQRLLLGAGPATLECAFPGVLRLNQDSTPVATVEGGVPSLAVRSVQLFLSEEGEGLNCASDACDGQADAKTLAAVASYVRKNFANLTAEEQAAFGATSAAQVEAVLLARSPIDVIPTFARIFDVPPAQ